MGITKNDKKLFKKIRKVGAMKYLVVEFLITKSLLSMAIFFFVQGVAFAQSFAVIPGDWRNSEHKLHGKNY